MARQSEIGDGAFGNLAGHLEPAELDGDPYLVAQVLERLLLRHYLGIHVAQAIDRTVDGREPLVAGLTAGLVQPSCQPRLVDGDAPIKRASDAPQALEAVDQRSIVLRPVAKFEEHRAHGPSGGDVAFDAHLELLGAAGGIASTAHLLGERGKIREVGGDNAGRRVDQLVGLVEVAGGKVDQPAVKLSALLFRPIVGQLDRQARELLVEGLDLGGDLVELGLDLGDILLVGAGTAVDVLESLEDAVVEGGLLGACRRRGKAQGNQRDGSGETGSEAVLNMGHDGYPLVWTLALRASPSRRPRARICDGALTGRSRPLRAR